MVNTCRAGDRERYAQCFQRRLLVSCAASSCFRDCNRSIRKAVQIAFQSTRRVSSTYHDLRGQTSLGELVTRILYILSLVIRSAGTASKDNMDIWVTLKERYIESNGSTRWTRNWTYSGLDDTAQSLLSNTEEDMSRPSSTASINCDSDTSVRGVLESGGH